MFKVGDKVFDNERGYGEGVVRRFGGFDSIIVDFKEAFNVTYTIDGRWLSHLPVTLFKKEEKMKNYYYVGQKVSCQGFGDGIVIELRQHSTYPVVVQFEGLQRVFTEDGRYETTQLPSLSQKPHIPLELEEVVSFEKGVLVWVKIQVWEVRYYSHYDGKQHRYFNNQLKDGYTNPTQEVRKFSDNPLA